jgi:hypothetical protein
MKNHIREQFQDSCNRSQVQDNTAAERNRRRRIRVARTGGRRIDVVLQVDAARALDGLLIATGQTICDCVSKLLIDATGVNKRGRSR